ncbi:hypothetical protein IWW56_005044 [Coemansia sp. RSA 2131]|nr:hypothetical protein IWW56_005044 [Coemansia sp. RSA 2131]
MAIQNLFVPRARIASFDVVLRLEDLNNVPPLNGLFYAKWKCQTHNGTSSRVPVVNCEVLWSHSVRVSEVYSHMRMKVGALAVNLSEYARLSGSSRRYFLQECKLNCTLKLSISITQTDGPDNFAVPPLDRSMVLTDLNDIITSEGNTRARDTASVGNSMSSQQPSRRTANASSSSHSTTRSATTETSQSRGLLPIDNTNVRDLAPFQRSSRKNQQIVDDVFAPSSLPL